MVIYVGLPRVIYSPMKHVIFHPRLMDLVFPDQPILRALADDHSFVTLVQNSDFNSMQRNVIREWIQRPVSRNHRVYQVAASLSTRESDAEFWSETDAYSRDRDARSVGADERSFVSATEDHGSHNSARGKKKKLFKTNRTKRHTNANVERQLLMPLNEYSNVSCGVDADDDQRTEVSSFNIVWNWFDFNDDIQKCIIGVSCLL